MGIDAIKAKIVNDAAEYADGLVSEANREAENILAQAKKDAAAIREQMAARGNEDMMVVKQRMEAAAELEARKMRLSVKQKVAAGVMETAIDHLADMKQPEYVAFLVKKIVETGVKEGQLLLNARDKAAVGAKLVAAANETLKDGKITLADGTMDAKGGFILRRGAMEINSSLETMVHSVKEKVAAEVVAALFQE